MKDIGTTRRPRHKKDGGAGGLHAWTRQRAPEWVRLYDNGNGLPAQAIADRYGVWVGTVKKWLKRMGVTYKPLDFHFKAQAILHSKKSGPRIYDHGPDYITKND